MKLIASGVTFSAASIRSPSFSRSSSSTITIIRPARISSMAVGTLVKGGRERIREIVAIWGGQGVFQNKAKCRSQNAESRKAEFAPVYFCVLTSEFCIPYAPRLNIHTIQNAAPATAADAGMVRIHAQT